VGDIATGLARYTTYCAGCHTANVMANVLNVTNASTLTGLNASIVNVGSMSFLGTALTAQDRLDISAYINSAK
jgi:mono/diheme cytochrome c family protein